MDKETTDQDYDIGQHSENNGPQKRQRLEDDEMV